MNISCLMVLLIGLQLSTPAERLLAGRTRAYDAMYRNDAAGLRDTIAQLDKLAGDATVGRMALYYAAWSEWSLVMSEMQATRVTDALAAAERSTAYSRRALQQDPDDPEVLAMLANGLISVAILDRPRLTALLSEVQQVRRKALERGPSNPRVVMMDAGMVYNNPEDPAAKEKGLARWLEAIELLEREARSTGIDPLRPQWGRALAYGWLAQFYLAMSPPQPERAREAANTALTLRPDFWYVNDQVLPRLAK